MTHLARLVHLLIILLRPFDRIRVAVAQAPRTNLAPTARLAAITVAVSVLLILGGCAGGGGQANDGGRAASSGAGGAASAPVSSVVAAGQFRVIATRAELCVNFAEYLDPSQRCGDRQPNR